MCLGNKRTCRIAPFEIAIFGCSDEVFPASKSALRKKELCGVGIGASLVLQGYDGEFVNRLQVILIVKKRFGFLEALLDGNCLCRFRGTASRETDKPD